MMTVIPTRRPWFTPGRLVIAVAALAVASSAALLVAAPEGAAAACLASAH